MSSAVEHVRVGKYCFPLFSHPFFRSQVGEEQYVEARIQSQLDNATTQRAIERLVEELLHEGREGASEEDIERMVQAHLIHFDTALFMNQDEMSGEIPAMNATLPEHDDGRPISRGSWLQQSALGTEVATPHPNCQACEFRNVEDGQPSMSYAFADPPTRRFAPAPEMSIACPAARCVLERGERQLPPLKCSSAPTYHSRVVDGVEPTIISTNKFITGTRGREAHRRARRSPHISASMVHPSPSGEINQNRAVSASSANSNSIIPVWHNALRTAIYSLLNLRLQEPVQSGVALHDIDEMAQSDALMSRQAIQSHALTTCDDAAFASLDVLMDGNSMCIRRRRKPTELRPTQVSSLLMAMKEQEQAASANKPSSLLELRARKAVEKQAILDAQERRRYQRLTGRPLQSVPLSDPTVTFHTGSLDGSAHLKFATTHQHQQHDRSSLPVEEGSFQPRDCLSRGQPQQGHQVRVARKRRLPTSLWGSTGGFHRARASIPSAGLAPPSRPLLVESFAAGETPPSHQQGSSGRGGSGASTAVLSTGHLNGVSNISRNAAWEKAFMNVRATTGQSHLPR